MPLLVLFLLLLPRTISTDNFSLFIVWNVGQGTSTTYVDEKECLHVDFGGEDFPKKLHNHCQNKMNQVFLTHFDKDHINFIKKAFKKWPRFCLNTKPPRGLTRWKINLLANIPHCSKRSSKIKTLGHPNFSKRNDSYGYLINESILVTGDATTAQEKNLLKNLKQKSKIHTLLAGHHGSRTSTGNHLLENLPELRLVIVSARKKKYGHPHKETITRLKQMALPWIDTETYGHIHLQIP